MAWNICVDLTLACLPQTLVVSLSSDSPRTSPFVPTVLFTYEGASPGVGTLPLLQFLQGHRYHPIFSFIFPPLFLFHSLSYMRIFSCPLGVQGPLLEFSRCSERTVQLVDVLLMYLWEEMNSTCSFSSVLSQSLFLSHFTSVVVEWQQALSFFSVCL